MAFGHQVINTLDVRMAQLLVGGPAQVAPPPEGPGRVRHAWQQWRRAGAAWAIACGLLLSAVIVVGDPDRTAQLNTWLLWLSLTLLLWLFAGPLLAHARELHATNRPRARARAELSGQRADEPSELS